MNDSHPPTAQSPNSPRRRRSSWIIWLWFWITVGIVAIVQIPQEITAWKYAAALEAREARDKERSRELLAEVMKQDPAESVYRRAKLQWDYEDGRYADALSALEELLKQSPKNIALIHFRGQLLLHLRRYPEAVADAKHVWEVSQATGWPLPDNAVNGLAYARAVGKVELDQATDGMDAVVKNARVELSDAEKKLQAERVPRSVSFWTLQQVAESKMDLLTVLDTRGFAALQRSEHQKAEADLDEAVRLAQDYERFIQQHGREFSSRIRELSQWEEERKTQRHTLAVIIYHRGLAREKLGREADAKLDFARVRELIGKEPDESLF